MKLAVGFLTYQEASAKYLEYFLPSLAAALSFLSPADFCIYAFDNSAAADLSNQKIVSAHQNIKYLTQGRNLGFAAAYNILIKAAIKAGAEYFLVINPDTMIEPGAIKILVEALDNDGSLGSASPKILRWDFAAGKKTEVIDSLGLVLSSGLKFGDLGQGSIDSRPVRSFPILGPSGAAGLFRLEALARVAEANGVGPVQYFDERFFMYKEDCDLAYRLFLAGYNSRLVAEAIVYHDRTAAVSGQGITTFWRDRQSKSRQVRAWSFRNQHLLYFKHWKKQNFVNKFIIIFRVFSFLLFSLILEKYLLKEYPKVWQLSRRLTNIK